MQKGPMPLVVSGFCFGMFALHLMLGYIGATFAVTGCKPMKMKIRKCHKCERAFKPFEVAYRMPWYFFSLAGKELRHVHVCERCAPRLKVSRDSAVRTCFACGFTEAAKPPKEKAKPLKKGEAPKLPEKWYCGWRCKRSAKAMIARVGLYCEGCGTALLKAGRNDVRYCGSACRQKAYRDRAQAAVSEHT
jgi:hypothetical protein